MLPLIPIRRKKIAPMIHPAEGAAAAVAAVQTRTNSMAALLASHILRDGELVLLVLKPSFWFIIFSSASFSAVAIVLSIALWILNQRTHGYFYFESAAFCITGRVMWAVLQWMGRLYILTDMRVLRVSGVFSVDIFDCALRKIVRTRIVSNAREKLVWAGSIEIIPKDEAIPAAIWQTISKPHVVHEKLMAAISRARQSGMGLD